MIRLLIVDDHPAFRRGLELMLSDVDDIEVVAQAASGEEAVELAAQATPDVVLMDLRMPGGDGVAAIRELKAQRSPARILVLTTYDTDRDILAAMHAGAAGYLLKDAPRADLLRALHDVAAGRPVLAPRALAALSGRGGAAAELTARETEVLREIAGGGTNATAARALMVSEATVKSHLNRAYAKLGVGDRAAAVRVAYERGLL